MSDGVKRGEVLAEDRVMSVHRKIGLMDNGPAGRVVKEYEPIAATADAAQPSVLGVPDQPIEEPLLLSLEFEETLTPRQVEHFDARRSAQAVNIPDLADTPRGKLAAVG